MEKIIEKSFGKVFKRHKVKSKISLRYIVYKVGREKYFVKIYPIEKYNKIGKGHHICRLDTKNEDNVYYVKPESIERWLDSIKITPMIWIDFVRIVLK